MKYILSLDILIYIFINYITYALYYQIEINYLLLDDYVFYLLKDFRILLTSYRFIEFCLLIEEYL